MTVEDTSEKIQNEERGFAYFIKVSLRIGSVVFGILCVFAYLQAVESNNTFIYEIKNSLPSIIGFMIGTLAFCALISFTEPADYMHVKIKLDALERNKDQLRRIVQDVVNEETKDNNSIDKEKVKKITTTLIAESLILDDEKK